MNYTYISRLMVIAIMAAALEASAAGTWDAGGGADTNWSTGANWDDDAVPADGTNVTFATAGSVANLDSSRSAGRVTFNRAGFLLTNSAGATLTVTNGLTFSANNITNVAPILIVNTQAWAIAQVTLAGPLSGSGPVFIPFNEREVLYLRGDASGFSGGFTFTNKMASGGSGYYESSEVFALGANSLSAGPSRLGRSMPMQYTSGALASAAPPLVVNDGAELYFANTPIAASDRFAMGAGSVVYGTAAQLGALTCGSNITLAAGAIVGHDSLNQATISSLPTNASLVFGIANTFNSSITLNAGFGTPWGGLSAAHIKANANRLQKGTISINSTGLSEFTLSDIKNTYSPNTLILGNAADAPAFTLAAGSPIPARINGSVSIDTTAPSFAAFNKFLVAKDGILYTTRNGGLAGKPVDLEGATLYLAAAVAGSPNTAGAVTVANACLFQIARKTAGTPDTLTVASLTRSGRGVLRIHDVSSSLGSDEQVVITDTTGLTRGNIVDPWIIRLPWNFSGVYGDFMTYGATGFTNASALYTTTFGNGAIISGVTTVSGSVNADSLRVTANIADGGSGIIHLGVLPSGSQAARAGMMNPGGQFNVSPAIDTGGAELIVAMNNYNAFIRQYGNLTATNGLTMLNYSSGATLYLHATGNDIRAPINILGGTLTTAAGNGLSDSATVNVERNGSLYVYQLTGGKETIAGLSGSGTVNVRTSAETLEFKDLSTAFEHSGAIIGGGNLIKSGAGTQTLSGASTYSGTTTNNGGTLLVNGTHTGAGNYTVASGATFGGTGTISLATSKTLTVNAGGILAPGASVGTNGTLTVNGDLTLAENSVYHWDSWGGTSDLVSVNGVLTLPAVTTVIINPMIGTVPRKPAIFTFGSVAGASSLDRWIIQGPTPGYRAIFKNNSIILIPPQGTVYVIH